MKASELIKELEKLVRKSGDCDVLTEFEADYYNVVDVEEISQTDSVGEKCSSFLIV